MEEDACALDTVGLRSRHGRATPTPTCSSRDRGLTASWGGLLRRPDVSMKSFRLLICGLGYFLPTH